MNSLARSLHAGRRPSLEGLRPLQRFLSSHSEGFKEEDLGRGGFGELARLVGRYSSYLLPKQAGGTTQILVFKSLPMIERPGLYKLIG